MCEESGGLTKDDWLDVMVELSPGNVEETYGDKGYQGAWDIIVSFGIGDEVVLEQAMELPIAKVMILDYYAPIYARRGTLSIRRRRREWKATPNKLIENKLIEYVKGGLYGQEKD